MKSIRIQWAIVLAALTISAAWTAEDEVKKDMALLQGEWSMVSGSADGQPMPEHMRKQMKRVCKGSSNLYSLARCPSARAWAPLTIAG